jgi:hypothetical protein
MTYSLHIKRKNKKKFTDIMGAPGALPGIGEIVEVRVAGEIFKVKITAHPRKDGQPAHAEEI